MNPIRYFLIAILTFITLSGTFSQEIKYNTDNSVDLHFKTTEDWERYKKKIIYMNYDLRECDSILNTVMRPGIAKAQEVIKAQDSLVKKYDLQIANCKEQVTMLQGELIDIQTKPKPVVEWIGFYVGMSTGYVFADSVIGKETIINNVWNNMGIFGRGYVRIKDFMLTGGLEIPFRSKPVINVGIGYRIF